MSSAKSGNSSEMLSISMGYFDLKTLTLIALLLVRQPRNTHDHERPTFA